MGKVRQPGGAEDQGKPDGAKGQQQSKAESGDGPLDELGAEGVSLQDNAFAQEEERGDVRGSGESHGTRVLLALGQGRAFGERGFIQLHLKCTLFGNPDGPGTVLGGLRLGFVTVAARLDGDAGNRCPGVSQDAADAVLVLGAVGHFIPGTAGVLRCYFGTALRCRGFRRRGWSCRCMHGWGGKQQAGKYADHRC